MVITSAANPFTQYYAEILRTEGLNAFAVADILSVTSSVLAAYDLVILGDMPVTSVQASMFSAWVKGGGNLVAMRPGKQLAGLLGLTDAASTLSNAYLLVDTTKGPGVGIVSESIQFHGPADLYALSGATSIATLYSDAVTPTPYPAVTLVSVGSRGGQAAAFTYDLARSVVYTRQGNPAWSGQARDGSPPIRSQDLFFGAASFDPQPDWVDLSKVAIPQADEQQRLLVNLILRMNQRKKPLARFWYFPKGLKAVVIMTGDDHGQGGTAARFDQYIAASPPGRNVANWECIRSTSYVFPGSPLTDAQAAYYTAQGFEVALHVNTNCEDWTPSTLASFYTNQLSQWQAQYPSVPGPATNRTHCVIWSDYATQPQVELKHNIRLDTSYYYWPRSWIQDRPGMFTGSGIPMRFTDAHGNLIDVYQAPTQMTDESKQSYPATVNALLDNALGPAGYYGAFTVNAHTDKPHSKQSDAVVASAMARGVPIVSARQMLRWLDGRNSSSFGSLAWQDHHLTFAIKVGSGAENLLQAMLPVSSSVGLLAHLTLNGRPIAFTLQVIKGVRYASFPALPGAYRATYGGARSDTVPPVISKVTASSITASGAKITWNTDEAGDSQVEYGRTTSYGSATPLEVDLVTSHSAKLTGLLPSTLYHHRVKTRDAAGNLSVSRDFTFITPGLACPCSIWSPSVRPTIASCPESSEVEVGVKFRADYNGFITGLRFYKGSGNSGTHIGNLWTTAGTLLATAIFAGESATGWQQVDFATPAPIRAGITYVASYHTDTGYYAYDESYFANTGVDNAPLHALADGVDGRNGVYKRGATGYPDLTYRSANYWVDVVYVPDNTLSGDFEGRGLVTNGLEGHDQLD